MLNGIFNFFKEISCRHAYAEVWDGVVVDRFGGEMGYWRKVCTKCGRVIQ